MKHIPNQLIKKSRNYIIKMKFKTSRIEINLILKLNLIWGDDKVEIQEKQEWELMKR